ncbi:chromate transporter [Malikia sp.]|uniref:chromate transporter n=1 Tax=Malikia sp. TaxID=2070706 RepID=UPI00261960AD|nr:chromate transporter [Malikia sp.]MDD2728437.1 chromate transporter [Malikia sp.]
MKASAPPALPASTPPPAPGSDPGPQTEQPRSRADLFWSFNWLALQGFGGLLAVVQRELVEKKRWYTREQFLEEWAVAQIMPGPNVVNLGMTLGARHFGLSGALAVLFGLLTLPLLLILTLAVLYSGVAEHAVVRGALRGMGAVSAGLILATALKLAPALKTNPMGTMVCALLALTCFVAVALLRLPLAWVLLAIGGMGWWWAARCIRQADQLRARGRK